jgi:predicted unusual protein kinase regulating ubiquinone biosynthesis (AarF/ABC1/UbiB family)
MGFFSRDPELGDDDVAERVIAYFQRKFLEQMTLESFSLKDIQLDMKSKIEALADLRKLDVSFRDLTRAFQVPKEWVVFERASILLLGLCTQIDSGMNPLKTVGPYLQEFVLGRDRDWKVLLQDAVRDMAMSVVALPDATHRFLARANRGDLQLHVEGLRESAVLLYAAGHQLMFAFLAVSSGVLAYALSTRGNELAATGAAVLSVLFLLSIAVSMVRVRRLRRTRKGRPRS